MLSGVHVNVGAQIESDADHVDASVEGCNRTACNVVLGSMNAALVVENSVRLTMPWCKRQHNPCVPWWRSSGSGSSAADSLRKATAAAVPTHTNHRATGASDQASSSVGWATATRRASVTTTSACQQWRSTRVGTSRRCISLGSMRRSSLVVESSAFPLLPIFSCVSLHLSWTQTGTNAQRV